MSVLCKPHSAYSVVHTAAVRNAILLTSMDIVTAVRRRSLLPHFEVDLDV